MKRNLVFTSGIIGGDLVRSVTEVFPNIEDKFRQRKTYDEYYFDGGTVTLTIETIQSLNDLDLAVKINYQDIIINS
jgi:hypothetical protein